MAKKRKPRKRERGARPEKALTPLEITYMVVGILAGIVNIVYMIVQMVKAP